MNRTMCSTCPMITALHSSITTWSSKTSSFRTLINVSDIDPRVIDTEVNLPCWGNPISSSKNNLELVLFVMKSFFLVPLKLHFTYTGYFHGYSYSCVDRSIVCTPSLGLTTATSFDLTSYCVM